MRYAVANSGGRNRHAAHSRDHLARGVVTWVCRLSRREQSHSPCRRGRRRSIRSALRSRTTDELERRRSRSRAIREEEIAFSDEQDGCPLRGDSDSLASRRVRSLRAPPRGSRVSPAEGGSGGEVGVFTRQVTERRYGKAITCARPSVTNASPPALLPRRGPVTVTRP
jgi:hypothetical protein